MSGKSASLGNLLAACVLSAIGISCWNIMPVILGSAADTFSLTDQQIGLLASSLLAGWLVATLPAYFFMHKLDRRWVVVFGSVLAAIAFSASQFVQAVNYLNLSWGIAGFGMAIVYCVSIQLIAELGQMERAFGFKIISEVFSASAFLYVFPVFIIVSWQYAGTSYGLAAIYLSAVCFLYWVTPRAPEPVTTATHDTAPIAAWIGLVGVLIALSGITAVWAFLERIGNEVGATPGQMGMILAVLKVIGGMAGFTAVIAAAKYGLRWPHIVTATFITIGMGLLQLADGVYLYAAGAWIWEFGFTLGFGYQCAVIARLDPSGRLLLLIPSCIGLAGVIGPGLAGYIKTEQSYLNIYCFAVICAVITSTVFLLILKNNREQVFSTKEVVV